MLTLIVVGILVLLAIDWVDTNSSHAPQCHCRMCAHKAEVKRRIREQV